MATRGFLRPFGAIEPRRSRLLNLPFACAGYTPTISLSLCLPSRLYQLVLFDLGTLPNPGA
jgi:hypothetical protein